MKITAAPWLCLCLLTSPALAARNLDVRVLDQDGLPLEDAVVTLRPTQTAVPKPATAATAVIDQYGKMFVPHVLVVHPGTQVAFPNSDHVRHHVYSFSPPKPFELKLYSRSEVPTVTFEQPGVVSLGCNIHDWMEGYIYVTDDPLFAQSTADGIGHLANLAEGSYAMHIWHPRLRGPYMGEEFTLDLETDTPAQLDYHITIRSRLSAQRPPDADINPAYDQRF